MKYLGENSLTHLIEKIKENMSSGVVDYNELENKPITQLTGTDTSPIYLRTLQTGAYILNGTCSPYSGSEAYMTANSAVTFVNHFETVTAVQIFYPPYNQVQYFEVYDASYTTKTVALNEMATKLEGIEDNANNYSLPTASKSVLGGVKIGENLTIGEDGTLNANASSGEGLIKLSGTVDVSTLEKGVYISGSDDTLITCGTATDENGAIKKGSLIVVTWNVANNKTVWVITNNSLAYGMVCTININKIEYSYVITNKIVGNFLPIASSDNVGVVKGGDNVHVDSQGALYADIPTKLSEFENDIGVGSGTGNVSSDIVNSIMVVDELPETEVEGVLYLVKEIEVEEPTIEYVTNPTMEMGSISRDGTLSDSTEYCRTADYVYVYGKNSVTITSGTGSASRITCYDANKNFLANWFVDTDGTAYSYRNIDDGSGFVIPEGCYYIKVRISATEVKPITIKYND